jgi:hypothetical protein
VSQMSVSEICLDADVTMLRRLAVDTTRAGA